MPMPDYTNEMDFEIVTTDGTVYQRHELVPSEVAGRTIPVRARVIGYEEVGDWIEIRLAESGRDYTISFPEAYVARICARDA